MIARRWPLLRAVVALPCAVVLLSSCHERERSSPAAPLETTTPAAIPTPSPTPTPAPPPPRRTPEEIVADRDAILSTTRVRRNGHRFAVTGLWIVSTPNNRHRQTALATSTDGFVSVDYEAGGIHRLSRQILPVRPRGSNDFPSCAFVAGGTDLCIDPRGGAHWTSDGGTTWSRARLDLDRLMPAPTVSLRPGLLAVRGGSDGATLYPFERVLRSLDEGTTWTRFDLPRFDGNMAYSSGAIATADGRLVVLLEHFSDDRRNRPAARHHGLYTSAGSNWSVYRPVRARFSPRLQIPPGGWPPLVSVAASSEPDPVIWVTTWDRRLYVSTDDAASFREIPVR